MVRLGAQFHLLAHQSPDLEYFVEAGLALRQMSFQSQPCFLANCLVDIADNLLRAEMPRTGAAVTLTHAPPESMGSLHLYTDEREWSFLDERLGNGFQVLPGDPPCERRQNGPESAVDMERRGEAHDLDDLMSCELPIESKCEQQLVTELK